MIYAGIDVNIISHARAFIAGPEAMGLWTWSMCYAQVHETDGRVPRAASLAAWGGRRNIMLAQKLVASGLWLAREDGDWDIWNYGKKNQSAEDIQRRKDAAKKRKEHWLVREQARKEREQNANGTRSVPFQERAGTPLPPSPSPPIQPPPTPPERGIGTALPSPDPVTKVRSRKKPETACPDSDASAADVLAWAARWRIPVSAPAFANFLDTHRKKDSRWRDWAAAWRTWLRREPEFAGGRANAPRQQLGSAALAPWMNPTESFDFAAGDK